MALPPKWCGNKWFSSLYSSTQAQPPQGQPSEATRCLAGRGVHVSVPEALSFVCGSFFSSSREAPKPSEAAAVFARPLLAFFPSSCWFKRKDVAEDTCRWWQPSRGPFSIPLLSLTCSLVSCSFERLRF